MKRRGREHQNLRLVLIGRHADILPAERRDTLQIRFATIGKAAQRAVCRIHDLAKILELVKNNQIGFVFFAGSVLAFVAQVDNRIEFQ